MPKVKISTSYSSGIQQAQQAVQLRVVDVRYALLDVLPQPLVCDACWLCGLVFPESALGRQEPCAAHEVVVLLLQLYAISLRATKYGLGLRFWFWVFYCLRFWGDLVFWNFPPGYLSV